MLTINSEKTQRRPKGEGSIYYKASRDLWCATIDLGVDADEKRIRKTVSAKKRSDVVKKMRVLLRDPGLYPDCNSESLTDLCDFIKIFLNEFKRNTVKSRTFEWYCDMANHIIRAFEGVYVQDVTSLQIQRFYNSLAKPVNSVDQPKSARTIKAIHTLLSQLFRFAVKQKVITTNPFNEGVVIPKVQSSKPKKEKAIPKYACKLIMEAIENSPTYKPIVTVLLYTGMRIGEVLALKWQDIDERNKVIYIERALTEEVEIDENFNTIGRKTVVGDTKTIASKRVVTVDQIVFDRLNEWKSYIDNKKKLKLKLSQNDCEDFIFVSQIGNVRRYQGFQKQFKRFLKESCLDKFGITFHMFRHTFATLLMEQGVNPRVVQELLGHKDIETTLGVYTSVSVESIVTATKKLGAALADIRENTLLIEVDAHKLVLNNRQTIGRQAECV